MKSIKSEKNPIKSNINNYPIDISNNAIENAVVNSNEKLKEYDLSDRKENLNPITKDTKSNYLKRNLL